MLETRNICGKFDTNLHLKSQLDIHVGRCEQLRAELKLARQEAARQVSLLERFKIQNENLEEQLKLIQPSAAQLSAAAVLALPQGMSNTSANVISSLNSHLLQVLHVRFTYIFERGTTGTSIMLNAYNF